MPRRLSPEQQRKRLRAYRARVDAESQDVDSAVEKALAEALDEFRRVIAEPMPAYIKGTPETPAEAAARNFEAGFLSAAVAFWDDIARGRERRRTAQGSGRAAAEKNRQVKPELVERVRAEAEAYRRRQPYAPHRNAGSTRAMARHIHRKLPKTKTGFPSHSTVLVLLASLRIR